MTTTRDELLEAIQHAYDTKLRLATQPGTHATRADIDRKIDDLLDQLNLAPAGQP